MWDEDSSEAISWWGKFLHEIYHNDTRYENKKIFDILEKNQDKFTRLLAMCNNMIEDHRIEYTEYGEFPGRDRIMDTLRSSMYREYLDNISKGISTGSRKVDALFWLQWSCFSEWMDSLQLVEDHAAMKMESVKKMEIGKGKFWVYGKRGQVVQLPLKVTHKYEQPGCHVCHDYVANLADVSTGSVGSPDGWSTVFVRTKNGDDIWSKAIAAGCFETKAIEQVKPGLELFSKLANEKITKNQKTVEERAKCGVNKALRNPYISPK